MSERMKTILEKYREEIECIYGSHLKKIVLYGSYARGEQKKDSDTEKQMSMKVQSIDD